MGKNIVESFSYVSQHVITYSKQLIKINLINMYGVFNINDKNIKMTSNISSSEPYWGPSQTSMVEQLFPKIEAKS